MEEATRGTRWYIILISGLGENGIQKTRVWGNCWDDPGAGSYTPESFAVIGRDEE